MYEAVGVTLQQSVGDTTLAVQPWVEASTLYIIIHSCMGGTGGKNELIHELEKIIIADQSRKRYIER